MGKSGLDQGKIGRFEGRTLGERVTSFLRAQHPVKTALNVEAETGVSAETVSKWLKQGNVPNGTAMLALIRRYKMTFLDHVLGDDWIAELARLEEQERLENEAAAIRQRLALVMGGRSR